MLGAEERLDNAHKKRWQDIFAQDKRSFRDFTVLVGLFHKFSENEKPVVVCDRAPYLVPVDHVHLFDLEPAGVRQGLAEAVEKVKVEGIPEIAQQVIVDGASLSESNRLKIWLLFDLLVSFQLRFFEGSAISDQTVQFWIEHNARLVRHALDPRMREAARRSLETVCQALLPLEYVKRTPDELGLRLLYREIRKRADPVLKRRNLTFKVIKGEELCKRFPEVDSHLIMNLAGCPSQEFALKLLSGRLGLKPGYLRNLIKRGNLVFQVADQWHEALSSIDDKEFVPPSDPL